MGRDGAVLLLQHIHRAVQMSDSFVIGTGDFLEQVRALPFYSHFVYISRPKYYILLFCFAFVFVRNIIITGN